MKRFFFILIAVFLSSMVLAADPVPEPEDFASGFIVEAPGAEAIYSLTVPEELYRHIYRKDLGDMRMYNARGEVVSHMLRRSVQKGTVKKETAPPVDLPFFPVYETDGVNGSGADIHVATNENGVVVDVKSTDSTAPGSKLAAYIIDASMLKKRPIGLRIDWTDNSKSFSVSVDVQGSNDLNRWHTMVRNAALVKLDFGGQSLRRQVIELPATDAKYMRLSWPREARDSIVFQVEALFHETVSVNRQVREWTDIEGRAVDEKILAYEYTIDAKFPVDAVDIKFPEPNSFMWTVVKSRNDEQSEWRYRRQARFYSLTVGGVLTENTPLSVDCAAARYWRLETRSVSGIGSGVPVLQLGWIPHELVFVARGEGPFTLAYGSAVVKMSAQPLNAMLRALGRGKKKTFVKEAMLESRIVLGGEGCFLPPKPPVPWKVWILWAVLVAGVAVLSIMACRLFHQMNILGKTEQ